MVRLLSVYHNTKLQITTFRQIDKKNMLQMKIIIILSYNNTDYIVYIHHILHNQVLSSTLKDWDGLSNVTLDKKFVLQRSSHGSLEGDLVYWLH